MLITWNSQFFSQITISQFHFNVDNSLKPLEEMEKEFLGLVDIVLEVVNIVLSA